MKYIYLLLALPLLCLSSCEKFLAEKSDKKLTAPDRLPDLQALMNNYNIYSITDPAASEISADDYYLNDTEFNSLSRDSEKRKYTWQSTHLFETGDKGNDWLSAYNLVYLANTILEKLREIKRTQENSATYDDIQGQAYFLRAKAYFNALQVWSLAYHPSTSSQTLGVVIREGTDFNKPSVRSSTEEGYEKVLDDLLKSVKLLSPTLLQATRPCRQAAYGYLSRVYLTMGNYDKAFHFADTCLSFGSELIDFNDLSPAVVYPITRFNKEVIYESFGGGPQILQNNRARIVSDLYNSYTDDDLRKQLYFRNNINGTYGWRGSFSGMSGSSTGITTDEQYLIRAECYARKGLNDLALGDLNTLLLKRYKKGTFRAYTTESVTDVKNLVLLERRKELVMRNLRWSDLKRLNAEGANIQLTRKINGETFELKANDPKYALEIPEDVVAIGGIIQNPR